MSDNVVVNKFLEEVVIKVALVTLIAMVCLHAQAEEKTCTVKGMTCDGCVGIVKEKVCSGSEYSTCEVEIGKIHVVTKDARRKWMKRR
ncbi:MAG: hypothetical protein HC902_03900 [Calothrix sp. SM1_5_4]|nr:hypothetical protein [Calothrix sp. SM1_5_4]